MSQNEHLYLLVHSLNPSEKRYFTLQAKQFSKDSKTTALKLFDALNKFKVPTYDEDLFIKQNKGKSFVKNLSYEKSYLIELILKVMRSFHAEKKIEYILLENNLDIHFLIDKGLTDQAIKHINKSYDIAKENKLNIDLLQLYTYKQGFITKGLINIDYDTYTKDINQTLDKVANDVYWYNLRLKVISLIQEPHFVNNINEVQGIVKQVENDLKEDKIIQSSRRIALNILQFYYNKIHNYEKALSISKEIIRDYELVENKKLYKAFAYIQMLSNILFAILNLEKLNEMPLYLEKLKSIKVNTEIDKINQFRVYTQHKLLYLINTKDFSNVNEITSEIENGIKRYKNQMSEKVIINFEFNLIILFFLSKNYKETEVKLNNFYKQYKKNDSTIYLYTLLECIEIMLLISDKAYDTANSFIRSWGRIYTTTSKDEVLFRNIEGVLKEFNNPNVNLLKKYEKLESTKSQIKWEQLKGLVLDWLFQYTIK